MSVIGLGTDIVEIGRFEQDVNLSRLARRILTENELKVFDQHTMPARFLAKRFAAKEAALKALGTGIAKGVSWQHIEITNDELGKPVLALSESALSLAKQKGAIDYQLSIADERHYAVATVILCR